MASVRCDNVIPYKTISGIWHRHLDSLSEKYDINCLNSVKCSNKFSIAFCSTPATVSGKEALQGTLFRSIPCSNKFSSASCSTPATVSSKRALQTSNKFAKGIHWSRWEHLCKPKYAGGIGFKDLFLFKKALIAKQVWRILSQPNCLLAKVLKARYYPFTDILSAKVGSYPSFTWRSICSARELIADGMLWQVGNGARINIWNDPWLPGKGNSRISDQTIEPNWTSVYQLIEHETSTWNKELFCSMFDDDTAARIFSIPLAGSNSEDLLVWKFEGSGEHTVKSRYRVLATEHLQHTTFNSTNVDEYNDFYKSLSLSVDIICPLCKAAPKDADHLMWYCGILQCVWASLDIKVLSFGDLMCCKERFVKTFSAVGEQQKHFIVIAIWSLCPVRLAITVIVARDSTGEIRGAETYLFEDVVDAFVAEARAYEMALIFASSMGFRRIVVEDGVPDVVEVRAMKDILDWNQSYHSPP
ncbi:hypothetical protein CXB51_012851 [Gossypium anomalum]|uniref:Reverse transcriptase zinc-binding domain-containing protein n=1 Tax=Gossypium anomalum TaxID=47600 RepID=A0A8J6D1I4_9ROSI|nr:hypothetical protein CXB51_012851 [Gossypium anomalum]